MPPGATTTRNRRTSKRPDRSKLMELVQDSYIGVVEEIDDPEFRGRCRIRVFGVYGDDGDQLGKIPTNLLPWAYPYHGLQFSSDKGAGRFSTPKMNAVVRVIFEGDQYHPRYFALEEVDPDLQAVAKGDYHDFHSLLWDTGRKMHIYYAVKTGILFELDTARINLAADGSILIQNKDSKSMIEMRAGAIDIVSENTIDGSSRDRITFNSNAIHVNGNRTDIGASPIYSSVNGEMLMILLSIIATGQDIKYPPTPGQFAGIVEQMKPQILSTTVKVSP